MDLDKTLADHLATWGRTRRGWDKAGCLSQLATVKGRSADDVAMAWIRFCADGGVRSPGAFPNLAGPHWSEKVAPPQTPRPLKPHEACTSCGRALHRPDDVCTGRPQPATHAPHIETVRHLVDVMKRGLCAHGVAPELCIDHRGKSKPETEPEETA